MINIALFKNDRKEKEGQPDYKGYNKDTGDSVAGWVKEASNGKKYISLRFETAEEKQAHINNISNSVQSAHQQSPQSPKGMNDFDDDIPF